MHIKIIANINELKKQYNKNGAFRLIQVRFGVPVRSVFCVFVCNNLFVYLFVCNNLFVCK